MGRSGMKIVIKNIARSLGITRTARKSNDDDAVVDCSNAGTSCFVEMLFGILNEVVWREGKPLVTAVNGMGHDWALLLIDPT